MKNTDLEVVSDDGQLVILRRRAAALAPGRAANEPWPGTGDPETVTVTGYRASLASSTNAKRGAVVFSDSIFAEDIG